MEEVKKYYTPEISEFHIGFECEFASYISDDPHNRYSSVFDGWRECLINSPHSIPHGLEIKMFRVKYLDKSDIEELGWKLIPNDDSRLKVIGDLTFGFTSESGYKYRLEFHAVNNYNEIPWITILIDHSDYNSPTGQKYEIYFTGNIKNKADLKKLLTWMKLK